jgi:hypothetical protein
MLDLALAGSSCCAAICVCGCGALPSSPRAEHPVVPSSLHATHCCQDKRRDGANNAYCMPVHLSAAQLSRMCVVLVGQPLIKMHMHASRVVLCVCVCVCVYVRAGLNSCHPGRRKSGVVQSVYHNQGASNCVSLSGSRRSARIMCAALHPCV